jgi:hypothetical protein
VNAEHAGSPSHARAAESRLRADERQRCEVWTRVMGYHRPVAALSIGKQAEVHERRYFVEAPTD